MTIVAGFEGLYTHAYKDSVGVTTICYGVTNYDRPVKMGDTATVAQCKEMLAEDLPRYKKMVDKCIRVSMPPYRTASMVSFVYNVGQGNLCKSSVARKLNAGDVQGGCDALLLWDKAGGRTLKGLTNRRVAERKFCLRSD
jgi:lysozyme